jgi:uncharacterized membrane protein YeaQ/YmgE (transglycosylase-associated protein family)
LQQAKCAAEGPKKIHEGESGMLDFVAWVVVGACMGALSSVLMRGAPLTLRLLNMVVGVMGAFLAALILTPLFGAGLPQEGAFSLPALVVALFGAVGLLLVVNPGRRASIVTDY